MKATILLAALILLTSASAQAPQGSTVPGEISRLLEKHRADYLRGGADAWAAMYAEDAVFTGFRGSYVGRRAVRDYFAQVFKDFPNRTVNVSSTKIRVYNESRSPTVVLNVGDTGSRINASGKPVTLNARESLIWVKETG